MNNTALFHPPHPEKWLRNAFNWANRFRYFTFLEGNNASFPEGPFPRILGVANNSNISVSPFEWSPEDKWAFGFWTYDCKNYIEKLSSSNPAIADIPESLFFHPEVLISFVEEAVEISTEGDPKKIFETISNSIVTEPPSGGDFRLSCKTTEAEYTANVQKIKNQILEGDFYEINYCIAPYCQNIQIDPIGTFLNLNEITQSPFACLQKIEDQYLICSSPERFIKKQGNRIISQPIKGTMRRGVSAEEDEQLRSELQYNEKERAENVMIVDLVRNDLARSSEVGSVKVDELFGIYSFSFWHQMISTVSSQKMATVSEIEVIKNAFPMGSMTGAPKIQAMKMIEEYENFKRGIYSGTVGYFDPNGDFDFNVVIRSLIYDAKGKRITFPVGSAITYDSDPELEWQECWLKAKGMLQVLEQIPKST